jgi:hypothetical protein
MPAVPPWTKASRCASAGNRRSQRPATTSVPGPPGSTEPTAPRSAAVAPDSNSPSRLEALQAPMGGHAGQAREPEQDEAAVREQRSAVRCLGAHRGSAMPRRAIASRTRPG